MDRKANLFGLFVAAMVVVQGRVTKNRQREKESS